MFYVVLKNSLTCISNCTKLSKLLTQRVVINKILNTKSYGGLKVTTQNSTDYKLTTMLYVCKPETA